MYGISSMRNENNCRCVSFTCAGGAVANRDPS